MTTTLLNISSGITELLAKFQRDHPYTQHDLEMSVYKSELTNDEANLFMAHCVWEIRKELEFENPKAFQEISQDIDRRHFKWIRSWIGEFKQVDEVKNHLHLVLEFFHSRNWYSEEYERLATYKDDVKNAYLNIKPEKKDFKSKFSAYE